ncbi:calcium-binding protein [Microvirga brassicacearum]|uniref:Calcium-binding protein n=1 Tax=Microvirga brassicacearum TaxID=2580413 RepID=A0A5N3PAA1_9HYPH|nr:calcium-binding protein [Microvirga brassicacearum]KAB0266669.1 calcium-binding protein [Microvirga brassicacearum]
MATIRGTSSRDRLFGTGADDIIDGLGERDLLFGYAGNDILNGGNASDQLFGGTGDDILDGGTAIDFLDGGSGNDRLFGGDGNDLLSGAAGKDTLDGGAGSDFMYGGQGDDTFRHYFNELIGSQRDFMNGGGGRDFAAFRDGLGQTASNLTISATRNNNVMVANGIDTVEAKSIEHLFFEPSYAQSRTITIGNLFRTDLATGLIEIAGLNDTVDASATFTRILYRAVGGVNDVTAGFNGADMAQFVVPKTNFGSVWTVMAEAVKGSTSRELHVRELTGNGTQDTTLHRFESIFFRLGNGDHTLTIGDLTGTAFPGLIEIHLGDGHNIIDAGATHNRLRIVTGSGSNQVVAGSANDEIIGTSGADNFHGGGGNDYVAGFDGNDFLFGDAGGDVLFGGEGNDALDGGSGRDWIRGLAGDDTYTGGADVDLFQVHFEEGRDTFVDFRHGEDVVDLQSILVLNSFSDVAARMSQSGTDVWLDLGGGHGIVFQNSLLFNFSEADFRL